MNMFEAVAESVGDDGGRFDSGLPRSSTPSMIFRREVLEHAVVIARIGSRDYRTARAA
jgi:hypothetical protein